MGFTVGFVWVFLLVFDALGFSGCLFLFEIGSTRLCKGGVGLHRTFAKTFRRTFHELYGPLEELYLCILKIGRK